MNNRNSCVARPPDYVLLHCTYLDYHPVCSQVLNYKSNSKSESSSSLFLMFFGVFAFVLAT